jgi:hypothetical protein
MRLPLLVAGMLVTGCGSTAPQEFDGAQALRDIEQQMDFGPRIPGTTGHVATGDWILERLSGADTVIVQSFEHVTVDGDTLALRNFIARFRPDDQRRILYLAHWDTRPIADRSPNLGAQGLALPGANDGGSGVAILLGVADALRTRPPAMGVDLVFVDGEDYGDWGVGRDVLLGSRHYADHLLPGPLPEFAVVWDMVGDADLEVFQEGNSMLAAPDIVGRVWDAADQLGYGQHFPARVRHTITDDHVSLHAVGIKAVDVIDFDYGPGNGYWHTTDDTVDKVSAASLQIVGDIAMALLR